MAESGWLGRYEILGRLDANQNDELLLARAHGPAGFQQTVVLKRHLARCAEGAPQLERLAREALAYALVTHPQIVRLHDFVLLDGYPVLVLEHVHGLSLSRLVRTLRGRRVEIPDSVALFIGHGVFSALAAAHRARNAETGEFFPVIHRNVNPRSVLVAWTGDVKLGNFGIAKVAGTRRSDLTAPGTLHGTYGYMAPEQVLGDPLTVRTDVYMAALMLWELLARRRAFRTDGIAEFELLKAMAMPALPDLATLRSGLSAALCHGVRVSLSPSADARSLSAIEMANCIEEAVDLRAAREECGRLASSTRDTMKRAPPPSQAIVAMEQSGETEAFRTEDVRGVAAPRAPKDASNAKTVPPPRAGADSAAPPSAPMTSAPLSTPIPQSLAPHAHSVGPRAQWVASRPPRYRASSVAMLALAAIAAITIGFVATGAVTGAVRRHAAARPTYVPALAPTPSVSATTSSPFASAAASAEPPRTTGRIVLPARAAGHRIFIDDRVVGEGQGVWPVACGRHVVRIGSRAKTQSVDVPCGGDVDVE